MRLFYLLASLALTEPLAAQTRTITIISPGGAGTNNDVVLRTLAPELGRQLGASIVIENAPQANGTVAAQRVARAQPDGNTLFFSNNGQQVLMPALRVATGQELLYDPHTAFQPIMLVMETPFVISVSTKLAVTSFADLVRAAKDDPDGLVCGWGNPTGTLLCGLLQTHASKPIRTVFHQGEPPATQALLQGSINILATTTSGALPLREGRQSRVIGILGTLPSQPFPSTPILASQGCMECKYLTSWTGFFAPKGLSAHDAALIEKAVLTALTPIVRSKIEQSGSVVTVAYATAMRDRIAHEIDDTIRFIKRTGIKF